MITFQLFQTSKCYHVATTNGNKYTKWEVNPYSLDVMNIWIWKKLFEIWVLKFCNTCIYWISFSFSVGHHEHGDAFYLWSTHSKLYHWLEPLTCYTFHMDNGGNLAFLLNFPCCTFTSTTPHAGCPKNIKSLESFFFIQRWVMVFLLDHKSLIPFPFPFFLFEPSNSFCSCFLIILFTALWTLTNFSKKCQASHPNLALHCLSYYITMTEAHHSTSFAKEHCLPVIFISFSILPLWKQIINNIESRN